MTLLFRLTGALSLLALALAGCSSDDSGGSSGGSAAGFTQGNAGAGGTGQGGTGQGGASDGPAQNCQARCTAVSTQCQGTGQECSFLCAQATEAQISCTEHVGCDQAKYNACFSAGQGGSGQGGSGQAGSGQAGSGQAGSGQAGGPACNQQSGFFKCSPTVDKSCQKQNDFCFLSDPNQGVTCRSIGGDGSTCARCANLDLTGLCDPGVTATCTGDETTGLVVKCP